MPVEADGVWVFCGENGVFPSGVFVYLEDAEAWIRRNRLSGTLTWYPLDAGAYDWAVQRGDLVPRREVEFTPAFIGRYTSIQQPHFH